MGNVRMKKDQYVLLTGGKNNAGDHLIKHRAKSLLHWLKPEVGLIDFDGWKPLADSQLDIINESKACLLTGGPALHRQMHPSVYALRENLDEIYAPIITMGVGWHCSKGTWEDTHTYTFTPKSLSLLEKIESSGYLSSVRDYHTLNALHRNGFKNFVMTGCPALYSKPHISSNYEHPASINRIGFSLGVSLKTSKSMFLQMQKTLEVIKERFRQAEVTVVFHHSPSIEYLNAHGADKKLYSALNNYKKWLEINNYSYVDISGSAEKLISFYSDMDLHIGYRVHAHIFMNSINKPSVLLNEDGRGKALEKVIGGVTFDSYKKVSTNFFIRALHKANINYDNFVSESGLIDDLDSQTMYEFDHGVKFKQPRLEIDNHFSSMVNFINQLP